MELEKQGIAERKPINVPNSSKRFSLNPSLTSSIDNVIYRPPSHQYHYIQYYQPIVNATCQCSCSCGGAGAGANANLQAVQSPTASQINAYENSMGLQTSVDSQMVDAIAIVHRQANEFSTSSSNQPQKSQSETSLLNHSYQALKITDNNYDSSSASPKLKSAHSSSTNIPSTSNSSRKDLQNKLSEAMLTADEITVSESDNERAERSQVKKIKSSSKSSIIDSSNYNNANHIDIYCDGEVGEMTTDASLKEKNGMPEDSTDRGRPPLPPRPPPRPRMNAALNGK